MRGLYHRALFMSLSSALLHHRLKLLSKTTENDSVQDFCNKSDQVFMQHID